MNNKCGPKNIQNIPSGLTRRYICTDFWYATCFLWICKRLNSKSFSCWRRSVSFLIFSFFSPSSCLLPVISGCLSAESTESVFSRFLISPSVSGSPAVDWAKILDDALPVLQILASFALYFVGAVYDNGLLFLPCGFIFWGGFSYSLRTVLVCFLSLDFLKSFQS